MEVAVLKQKLSEKVKCTETEQSDITSLKDELTKNVLVCFDDRVNDLEAKKQNTLVVLDQHIHTKRTRISERREYLEELSSRVSGHINAIESVGETSEHGNKLEELRQEIHKVVSQLDGISTKILDNVKASFKTFSRQDIDNTVDEGYLGSFEFYDDIFKPMDVPVRPNLSRANSEIQFEKPMDIPYTRRNTIAASERRQHASPSFGNPRGGLSESLEVPRAEAKPLIVNKEFKVNCPEANTNYRCSIRKLENLADKRVAILDSAHNRVFLTNNEGKLLDTFQDIERKMNFLDMCLVKTDHLAIFCECNGDRFITIEVFTRQTFKHKQTIKMSTGTLTSSDLSFSGFEVEPKSLTFALSFPDRVLKIQTGAVVGLLRKNNVNTEDVSSVLTLFDFHTESLYTLDTARKTLERYDFHTGKVTWTVDSTTGLFQHFVPLMMRHNGQDSLVVVCRGRLFVFYKRTGQINGAKQIDTDVDALCVKGKGIIVGSVVTWKENYVIKLSEYLNILK